MHRRDFLRLLAASSAGALLGAGCTDSSSPSGLTEDGPWWLRGNYGPVEGEIEAFDLSVTEGAIPPELDGVFLRNGPNPVTGTSAHWFLGDAMLHGVRIQGGQALWYRNRYIDTVAYRDRSDQVAANRANTSVIQHAGQLLALYEGGIPHAIEAETLATLGEYDFGGALSRPMSAHPKVDPETGEMWFIGYGPFPPYLTLHVVDASGALLRSDPIDIPRSTMMHDFQLTRGHVVILDLPVLFDLAYAEVSGFPFRWDATAGARIGILPRTAPTSEITWFEVDTCYVFHTINAWDDAEGRVVLEGCRLPTLWADGPESEELATPWRWLLDPATGVASESQFLDLHTDFPRVDPRVAGREHRLSYGLRFQRDPSGSIGIPNAILKHDHVSGATTLWETGGFQPDEAVFVPTAEGEDSGYILSVLYDPARGGSEVVILDASQLQSGPIARIALPRRVPFGFHGEFIPFT